MRSVLAALAIALAAGMLASCGQASLTEYSPAAVSTTPPPDDTFATGVRNVFAAKLCGETNCHSGTNPAGDLVLDPTQLDCQTMYVMLVDSGGLQQRAGNGLDVDTAHPTDSLILTKPTNTVPHQGHELFAVNSPEYDVILHWIQAGAPDDCGGS